MTIQVKSPRTREREPTATLAIREICKHCSRLVKTGTMKSKHTGHKHKTKWNVTCKSSNVIYCIECKVCQMQYIGQTKRMIKERIGEQLGCIKRNKGKNEVYKHFNSAGHTGRDDVSVYILDFIFRHPASREGGRLRDKIEFGWIHRVKTSTPYGLNTMDNKYG